MTVVAVRVARGLRAAGFAAWIAPFLVIYAPACGRGFISDDFGWMRHGRLDGPEALGRILSTAHGFYRPVVSLSFGIDRLIAPDHAILFGLTNLALAVTAAWLVRDLAGRLGLGAPAALAAACVWMFNFHGINMSVLWLSGRTALWLTVFSLAAARALVRRQYALVAMAALLAMGSKEEAVVLPLLLTAWDVSARASEDGASLAARVRRSLGRLWLTWSALGGYIVMRTAASGMFIDSAPAYYQPVFDPQHLLWNALHYLDRSTTFTAGAVLLACVLARRLPALSAHHRRLVRMGAGWAIAGFALTVFLPVRSSLYAVFPSVGVALAGAAILDALFEATPARRRVPMLLAPFVLLICLLPVYRARNRRWVELADLSRGVIAQLRAADRRGALSEDVVIVDDTRTRVSLRNAWGSLFPDVARVMFDGRFQLRVVAPGALRPSAPGDRTVFRLDEGRLQPDSD